MEAYKSWVRRNKEYVNSLESLANGMTWLLPERFSDSEIGPEAVTSILGIVTAINEHIIDTTPSPPRAGPVAVEHSSFPYSLCITLLKDLETLVEVVAQQLYGDDKKWNFIALMEGSKVIVRLALLRNSGYKMLLHGGDTINVDKGFDPLNPQHQRLAKPGCVKNQVQNPWSLEGRALSALNRFGEKARTVSEPAWFHRVQHHRAMMEPPASSLVVEKPTLSTILSQNGLRGGLSVMGEVMFITRPLLYVLLIRKYGIRSWFPWLASLTLDLMGMGILSYARMSWGGRKDGQLDLSILEKDELRRRKLLWALYLMRDPFFSKYTRERLESTEKLLEPVPIFGVLAAKLIELITGAQTRYTYMSGS